MFIISKFNRKLEGEPGSSGGADDVIVSGYDEEVGANSGSASPDNGFVIDDGDTSKKVEGDSNSKEDGEDTSKPTDKTLSDIKDLNPISSDFLSSKYGDDVNLLKVDEDGNITNTEGEVLVTKEDYDKGIKDTKSNHVELAKNYIKSLETFRVEDEDGKYYDAKINEKGELVDSKGNVVMSSEDLVNNVITEGDYVDYDPDETSIYESANQITGFDFVDENGESVEFDETPEGLANRDLHLVQNYGVRMAQEQINKFLQDNPEMESFYNYVKVNGTGEGYGQRTNHEGIQIDKSNEDQQFSLVVEAEMVRGNSRERAENIAEMFKEKDKLFEESENSLSFLKSKDQEYRQADKEKVAKQQQEAQANKEKYANSVKGLLEKGKVLDYTIPKNIKVKDKNGVIKTASINDFFEYITVDQGNGLTQSQIDAQSEDMEYKVLIDYLRFTGNDINYLVNQKSNQKAVNEFKNKFSRSRTKVPKATIKVNNPNRNRDDDIAV